MTYRDIFKTERGSVYQFDGETGLWRRENREKSEGIYLGSINPEENEVLRSEGFNIRLLYEEFCRGNVGGFTYEFIVGNHPVGFIYSDLKYILERLEIGESGFKIKDGIFNFLHIGHEIAEVFGI